MSENLYLGILKSVPGDSIVHYFLCCKITPKLLLFIQINIYVKQLPYVIVSLGTKSGEKVFKLNYKGFVKRNTERR